MNIGSRSFFNDLKKRLMKRFRLVNMSIPSSVNATPGHCILSSFSKGLFSAKQILVVLILLCCLHATAQQNTVTDTAYVRVITERTAKIVNTLFVNDSVQYKKVHQQLTQQYLQLNTIQDGSKAAIAAIKAKLLSKEETDAAIKAEEDRKALALKQLHDGFIAQLKTSLSTDQIEKVKDGMTYRILPVTWTAYLDMIPRLTQEQKDKMYGWLVEARELAMDEGSSEKKHAVFGKYKGRINNYLSAAGYDMKKEGEDWQKRIQAAKDAKQNTN